MNLRKLLFLASCFLLKRAAEFMSCLFPDLVFLVYFLFGTDLESKSASKFDNS